MTTTHTINNQSILNYQEYFLVGIKGVGMAAAASCLLDLGKSVRGWDVEEDFVTQPMLDKLGIVCQTELTLPRDAEAVIFTAAHHDQEQPLVQQAKLKRIPCFSLAELTGELSRLKPTIAVCGVGGKSTTSAMLAWIMTKSSKSKASYMVGVGEIIGLSKTGAWSKESNSFIVEADEYAANPTEVQKGEKPKPRFMWIEPSTIVCTQILHDHPDVYPTQTDTIDIFDQFFRSLSSNGSLILNQDDPIAKEIGLKLAKKRPDIKQIKVGFSAQADAQLSEYQVGLGSTQCKFQMPKNSSSIFNLELQIPGKMNLWNAAAAVAAAAQHGISIEDSISALKTFRSTSRRLEYRGRISQTSFYDDYAHHPSEIAATIRAFREWYPKKHLTVIFQPHTYSRTAALLSDFARALDKADTTILLPIFASARESDQHNINSIDIIHLMSQPNSAKLLDTQNEVVNYLAKHQTDVVITMGAGDVYKIYDLLSLESPSTV